MSEQNCTLAERIKNHFDEEMKKEMKKENDIKSNVKIVLPSITNYINKHVTENIIFEYFTMDKTNRIFNIIELVYGEYDGSLTAIRIGNKYLKIPRSNIIPELNINTHIFHFSRSTEHNNPYIFDLLEDYLQKKATEYGFELQIKTNSIAFILK